ncbi:MAG: hypothetical protein MZU91_10605 [Desulfosudis oleivorans]|nr:hypothetical protein [Desulfosudis oleivorans]
MRRDRHFLRRDDGQVDAVEDGRRLAVEAQLDGAVHPDGAAAERRDRAVDDDEGQGHEVVGEGPFGRPEFRPAPGRAEFEAPFRAAGAEDDDLGVAGDRPGSSRRGRPRRRRRRGRGRSRMR